MSQAAATHSGENRQGGASLHLLLRCSLPAWHACQAAMAPGDSMVLMGTSVLWLLEPDPFLPTEKGVKIHVHSADLAAHGLLHLPVAAGMIAVDDKGLVELVCRHRQCLSWK